MCLNKVSNLDPYHLGALPLSYIAQYLEFFVATSPSVVFSLNHIKVQVVCSLGRMPLFIQRGSMAVNEVHEEKL